MSKYFLVLKVLLRLANFNAIAATEKTIFDKITIILKFKKIQNAETMKLISCSIPYLSLISHICISAYL